MKLHIDLVHLSGIPEFKIASHSYSRLFATVTIVVKTGYRSAHPRLLFFSFMPMLSRYTPYIYVYTSTHTCIIEYLRSSAICYCSGWVSILETLPTPHPLSWPLQILTTRRRNWRDISNLESFRDTHLLSRSLLETWPRIKFVSRWRMRRRDFMHDRELWLCHFIKRVLACRYISTRFRDTRVCMTILEDVYNVP